MLSTVSLSSIRFSPSSTQFSEFSGSSFVQVSSKRIPACFIDAFAYCWRFTFPGRGASPRKLRRNSIPSQLRSASEGIYKIIFRPKMSLTDLGSLRDPKMFSFLSSDGVKPLFMATYMIRKLEERDFPAILLATTFLGALGNTAVRGHGNYLSNFDFR